MAARQEKIIKFPHLNDQKGSDVNGVKSLITLNSGNKQDSYLHSRKYPLKHLSRNLWFVFILLDRSMIFCRLDSSVLYNVGYK